MAIERLEPADKDLAAIDELEPSLPNLDEDINSLDSVRLYFTEIAQFPLLSREQEVELAQKIETGKIAQKALLDSSVHQDQSELQAQATEGEEARQLFIQSNLRLVVSIAKRYQGQLPLPDLIQEGSVGLMKAVEKFDWKRGFKFSTYATWWIRQSIQRGTQDTGRTIRVPVHKGEALTRLKRVANKFVQENGRLPDEEEISQLMEITPDEVRDLINIPRAEVSLDMPLGDRDNASFGDLIPDESLRTEDEALGNTDAESLRTLLDLCQEKGIITEKEKFILEDYDMSDRPSFDATGRKLDLSRERVRQIRNRALGRIRPHFEELLESGDGFVPISEGKANHMERVLRKKGLPGDTIQSLIIRLNQEEGMGYTRMARELGIAIETLKEWILNLNLDLNLRNNKSK